MSEKRKKKKKPKTLARVTSVEVKEKKEVIAENQRQNEEEMITVSKENMKEMQARFDQRLNENIELKKRVAEWSNQIQSMSNMVQQAESNKKELAKKLLEVEKLLNTPMLGVATPVSVDGQSVHVYDCALCADKGSNQPELHTHLRQMHNVVRGEF